MTTAIIVDESFPEHFRNTMELVSGDEIDVEALRQSLLQCAIALTPRQSGKVESTERRRMFGEIRRVDCAKSPYTMPNQITR